MSVLTLALDPGPSTRWTLCDGPETLAGGDLDVLDLGRGMDEVVRRAHLAGRSVRVTVGPRFDDGLMSQVALRTIARVVETYDLRAEWKGDSR